jgi:predicted dithiol-disulfide oxidoreductase (DUF899 family)
MEGHRGPGRYGVDPRLDAEVEDLERRIEELKAQRSAALRRRGREPVLDHEVRVGDAARRLSDLFGDHDDLLLVHNMGRSCAYCTLWADGFVGLLPHLERRAGFALLTPDPPEVQRAFATSRGWPFVMASDPSREVARALGFATEAGASLPGVSALRRLPDGSLVRAGRAEFGPGDDFCAVWPLFDLLEGGAAGWEPRL